MKKLLCSIGLVIVSMQALQSQQYKVEFSMNLNSPNVNFSSGSWSITTSDNYVIHIPNITFWVNNSYYYLINDACDELNGNSAISARNTLSTSCDFEWEGTLPNRFNAFFESWGLQSIRRGIDVFPANFSVSHVNIFAEPISPCQLYTSEDSNTNNGPGTSLTRIRYRFVPRGEEAQLVGGQQITDFTLDTPFQFELKSGLPATWQYTLDDSATDTGTFGWVSFPFGSQTLSGLGISFNDLPPSRKIRFRAVVCSSNGVYTTPLPFDVVGEAPDLVGGVVNPIAPTCHYRGTGTNGLDGSFTATFDRDLGNNEKLGFLVLSEGPPNVFTTEVEYGEVRNSDLNNRTLSYDLSYEDLPPGRYRLKWQTGPDQPGDLDLDTVGKISPPFEIPNPDPVVMSSFTINEVDCEGDANGSITQINGQGGTLPYRYVLTSSSGIATEYTTNTILNLAVGDYQLHIIDANDCVSEIQNVQMQSRTSKPKLVPGTTTVNQFNEAPLGFGFINLGAVTGGNGIYTYEWSRDPDNGFGTVTDRDLSNIDPGEYSVVIRSDGCISDPFTFTINEPPPLSVTINANGEINCEGDTTTLEATANNGTFLGYSYEWYRGTVNDILLSETSSSLTVSQGDYTVRITDSGGNSAIASFTLNYIDINTGAVINEPLAVIATKVNDVICRGDDTGRISLDISGGTGTYRVFWDGRFSEGPQDNNALSFGDHTYEVFDGNNCSVFGGPIFIDQPSEINLGEDRVLCAAQELLLDATVDDATATYTWISDTGFSSTAPSITVSTTGNYTVTVETALGCTTVRTVFVDTSTKEIDAEFAMSSQVFTGEPMIAVDISYPLPDTVEWIVPDGATIIQEGPDEVELTFSEAGEYEIGIITTRGDCIAQKMKKVLVLEKEVTIEEDDARGSNDLVDDMIIYPNPNLGRFTVEVSLAKESDISLKVFNFANNTLMAHKIGKGETSYLIPFDISGISSGVYAVILETAYGTTLRKIVVR